jgi:adenylylsulfate kinase-like enzyme
MPPYIVVTGLAGSGKSTVARGLAMSLGLPVLDKDDFLEALYESLGIGDLEWRHRLSRASDDLLLQTARRVPGAILVSFWRHESSPRALRDLGAPLIEVHCHCDPQIAEARFRLRNRHPGHLDHLKGYSIPSNLGPLGLDGGLVTVDTSGPVEISTVSIAVGAVLSRLHA